MATVRLVGDIGLQKMKPNPYDGTGEGIKPEFLTDCD